MERNPINLVLASVDPGDADALELLTYVRRKHPEVPVVLMFPRVHPERAKEALRLGAMAVLKYPVPAAELRAAVLQALEQCEAQPADARPAGRRWLRTAAGPARPRATAGRRLRPASPTTRLQSNGSLARRLQRITLAAARPATTRRSAAAAITPRAPASPLAARADRWPRDVDLVTADPGLRQIVELAGTRWRACRSRC